MTTPPQPSAGAPADPLAEAVHANVSASGAPLAPHSAGQRLWYRLLRLLGWDIDGHHPAAAKYVLVVAPHTSNWDFMVGFITSRAIGMDFPHWIGKASLFKRPLGALLRRLGGIPVDRSEARQFVDQAAAEFDMRSHFILTITPEGTRGKTEYWRTGFYYIALRAGVPVVLGYLDYGRKRAGFGPAFMPSGDIEADFAWIRAFYAGIRGKYPDEQGEVRVRPRAAGGQE